MSYVVPEDENTEKEETAEEMLSPDDTIEEKEEESEEEKPKEESEEKKEDSEEKPEEKEEKPEEKKSEEEEKPEEKPEEEEEEPEDLTPEEIEKLPKDAKGLYYAYKKEKGKRQTAEAVNERREIHDKFHKDDKKPDEKNEEEKPPERDFETESGILKDKLEDDLLTVGEQKRITESIKNEKAYQEKVKKHEDGKVSRAHQKNIARLDALEDSFKIDHPDYPEYMDIYKQAENDMPALRLELITEAQRVNGNPAQKAYEIGKRFKGAYTAKKVDTDTGSPKKNTDKEIKKIIKNAKKKPSSSSLPGTGVTNEALDEMDMEDLGKHLNSLSMAQYMKVPRKIRNKVLG